MDDAGAEGGGLSVGQRPVGEVVYFDTCYEGAQRRPEVAGDEPLAGVELRVAARKGTLKAMPAHRRAVQSRQAGVRAKVEHPFLIA